MFFRRANSSGKGKSGHNSDKTDTNKDDVPVSSDRVISGQASNPNKDEIPDRGTRRIKGGGRVRERVIGYNMICYLMSIRPVRVAQKILLRGCE